MTYYNDETFETWYEGMDAIQRQEYDTIHADTTTPIRTSTMTYTYTLVNPNVHHLNTLRLILSLLNYDCDELDSDTTLITTADPSQVDRVCCDMGVLIAHEGQWLGCND